MVTHKIRPIKMRKRNESMIHISSGAFSLSVESVSARTSYITVDGRYPLPCSLCLTALRYVRTFLSISYDIEQSSTLFHYTMKNYCCKFCFMSLGRSTDGSVSTSPTLARSDDTKCAFISSTNRASVSGANTSGKLSGLTFSTI